MVEIDKCVDGSFCNGEGEAQAPHTCPFAAEIGGDEETLCTCCEECEGECAMEI